MRIYQSLIKRAFFKNLKYLLLVLICLFFASIRLFKPSVIIDGNTVWLLVIITAIFIAPELKFILPLIKSIRIGDTEIYLAEQTAKIWQDIEKVKEEVQLDESWEIPDRTTDEVKEVLKSAKDDPRAAFLLLATKIEEEVRNRLKDADLPQSRQFIALPRLVEFGVERQIFPSQLLHIFKEFWIVRNKVTHGQATEISDDTILSLIAVGADILRLISVEKK